MISVRGTLSIEDAITDCICHATELTKVGTKWGYSVGDVENVSRFLYSVRGRKEEKFIYSFDNKTT